MTNPVTMLGLGPMGRALAAAFLDQGHPTTVWNRTAAKASELVGRGAVLAATPADAVAASPLVVVCVVDYRAVRAILDDAGASLRGRALVNLTGDSPSAAREMAGWAAAHGIDYLDGAILTPAVTIGGPDAAFLFSGSEPVHAALPPALRDGATYLGTDPGRAAAYDVALLDLFWTSMSGVVHAFALAARENIAAKDLAGHAKVLAGLVPDLMDEFARHLGDDRFPGAESDLVSATAGMEHVLHAARAHGVDTGVLAAALATTRRAIDAGYGADGFSRVARLLEVPVHSARGPGITDRNGASA